MTRQEHDREDLLREAIAYERRIEWQVDGKRVFFGLRSDGSAGVYFDQDPVWLFNAGGQLRRAYRCGKLLKAEAGRLVQLERQRTAEATYLLRDELNEQQQAAVLEELHNCLAGLQAALRTGHLQTIGQVPDSDNLLSLASDWLERVLAQPLRVAQSPHASRGEARHG